SGQPSKATYGSYVLGLLKLSRELRKQSVPYTFEVGNNTLWRDPTYYDDQATPDDETIMLKEVAENADRLVMIEYNHFDDDKNGISDTLELSESMKTKGISTLY